LKPSKIGRDCNRGLFYFLDYFSIRCAKVTIHPSGSSNANSRIP
jgi:hypothetical protein